MMTWAIVLLFTAMALCFLELFVVSMGTITILGICTAGASCACAFSISGSLGAVFCGLNIVGMAVSFGVALKLMPYSPLSLRKTIIEDATSVDPELTAGLAGRSGQALTDLRPGGSALIDGRKLDVIAHGGYIDKGTTITVQEAAGSRIVVIASPDN
jgi:membrane-bound serine protease (ClpP class)